MAIQSTTCRRSTGRRILSAIVPALVLFGFALPAQAQDEMVDDETVGPPLPDAELAEIRGKFIQSDSVSFFGISMVTSWQDESGVTTVARLAFNVDFLANASTGKPDAKLMVGWVREGDPAMDVTTSHSGYTPLIVGESVLPVGSLGETKGAAQANVIAGADNAALNGMQIALIQTSSLPQMGDSGLTAISDTTALSFADGDSLEFRLGANELGLILIGNNGSDSTLQSVGGDAGRMLQQTVLNSDGNSVLNNAAVVIGTDLSAQGFDAIRASEALSSMKGHGF